MASAVAHVRWPSPIFRHAGVRLAGLALDHLLRWQWRGQNRLSCSRVAAHGRLETMGM